MKIILFILLGIVILLVTMVVIVTVIGYALSCKPYRGPSSKHFDGKKFINPSRHPGNSLKDVGKFGRTRQPDPWKIISDPDYLSRTIPEPTNGFQYTFINHSTFLFQLDGLNILTDPIWSERCSPVQFAGPKRMRPPGISFENLPPIDLVLISHNHYDHLDKHTIKRLVKRDNPSFIVPLGLAAHMRKYGCKKVSELDWWKDTSFQEIQVIATPANHFSSRGLFDRDRTLWAGYIIRHKEFKLYFAGDTGYSTVFEEIGQKEGPFDLSFIPIGAYLPKWFMSPIHVSPEEAVKIHFDVQSKQSVAMHFGTFPLADDNSERAIKELQHYKAEGGLNDEAFLIPKEGRSYKAKKLTPITSL